MGSPSQPRAKRGGGSVLVRAAGSAGHSKAAKKPGEERGGGGQSALQFEALRTKAGEARSSDNQLPDMLDQF